MAERSVKVTMENWTGRGWTRQNQSLRHGSWMNNNGFTPPEALPKVSINPDGDPVPGVAERGSESDGFMTGTEGDVTYANEQGASLKIGWNNPFVGGNAFATEVSEGFQATLGVTKGGDNAEIAVSLRKA